MKALEKFKALGWPSTKLETWKYTSTRKLQEKTFVQDKSPAFSFSHPDFVKTISTQEEKPRTAEQTLSLLNDVLVSEHFLVKIPAHKKPEETIIIKIHKPAENHARYLKLNIALEAEAEAQIFLEYEAADSGWVNLVIETQLAENAHLKFIHLCQSQAFHYVQHEVKQAGKSEFESLDLSLRAEWFRQNLDVYLEGERSRCALKGIYFGEKESLVDHHLCVHHEVPHGQSQQFFRGALKDRSKAVFNGKVIVAKKAAKTDASQKSDTILLDPHAEVNAKPELEIYTDDVMCAHGATVGELSEEAIFYLMARGIEKATAEKILLSGFLKEVVGSFEGVVIPIIDKRLEEF